MEYDSILMEKQEIIDMYGSIDEPEKICPLFHGQPMDWGLKWLVNI